MGLSPNALPVSVHDAYRVMKEQYLRLPPESRRRAELLRMLDESYAVLNDPEKREMYDTERNRVAVPEPEPEPKKLEVPMIEDEAEADAEAEVEALPAAEAEPEAAPEATEAAAQETVPEPAGPGPAGLRAAAALEATEAAEAATAETIAAREKIGAAQNGTAEKKPHGIAAVGASVLRIAGRGPKTPPGEEPEPAPADVAPSHPQPVVEARPDVEAVLLGRLAASVEELASSVRELTTTVQENGEPARPEGEEEARQ
jgi:hypothetical protein